jgi:hypothetical protein
MTAESKTVKQIPFGDDNRKNKCKGKAAANRKVGDKRTIVRVSVLRGLGVCSTLLERAVREKYL